MKYIVRSNELEGLINHLDKLVNQDIQEEINKMNSCVNKLVWKGVAYQTAMELYNNRMKEINLLPKYLNLYLNFMKKTILNYSLEEEKIKKDFLSLKDESYNLGGKNEL